MAGGHSLRDGSLGRRRAQWQPLQPARPAGGAAGLVLRSVPWRQAVAGSAVFNWSPPAASRPLKFLIPRGSPEKGRRGKEALASLSPQNPHPAQPRALSGKQGEVAGPSCRAQQSHKNRLSFPACVRLSQAPLPVPNLHSETFLFIFFSHFNASEFRCAFHSVVRHVAWLAGTCLSKSRSTQNDGDLRMTDGI